MTPHVASRLPSTCAICGGRAAVKLTAWEARMVGACDVCVPAENENGDPLSSRDRRRARFEWRVRQMLRRRPDATTAELCQMLELSPVSPGADFQRVYRVQRQVKNLGGGGEVNCACGCGARMERLDGKGRERRFLAGHNPKRKERAA